MQINRTYWEKVADTRWGKYITELEKEKILKGSKLAGIPQIALEVGCEGGRWSKMLRDIGWKMICTDVNQNSLNVCKEKIPDAKCILVSPEDVFLPVNDNLISLLLCIEVSPVIQEDWFIEEAYRVMKPGSIAVLMCWNKISLRGIFVKFKELLRRHYNHDKICYKRSYVKWRKNICKKGFEILNEVGFCFLPFSRDSNSKFIPVLTRIEKIVGLRNFVILAPWVILIARKNIFDQSDRTPKYEPDPKNWPGVGSHTNL